MIEPIGVYIHIPFCRAICPFCTFATAPRSQEAEEAYLQALCREIKESQSLGLSARLEVDSVYFGGGTPSVLSPGQIESIFEVLRGRFDISSGSETTLEIDPGTADRDTLRGYQDIGINRLSIGGQSLNSDVLRNVGRQHGAEEIFQTFEESRDLGFDNISLDLIVGLPGEDMERDLADLTRLAPEHASVYILDVSENLPMGRELKLGNRSLPDEVQTLDSYCQARDRLQSIGLLHYEISNYARLGYESRHNLKYWSDRSYLGFGASAHSYMEGSRFWNVRSPVRYVERVTASGEATEEVEPFDAEVRAAEHLFTGLRRADGVSLERVTARYGVSVLERFGTRLQPFVDLGLVEINDDIMKLTENGFLVSNEIFQVFI